MIADDCELTLVTTQAFNGKSYFAIALNGEVIPHQKHLSVTTDRMGYDEVNVTFILAPKKDGGKNKSLYLRTVEHTAETLQSI